MGHSKAEGEYCRKRAQSHRRPSRKTSTLPDKALHRLRCWLILYVLFMYYVR